MSSTLSGCSLLFAVASSLVVAEHAAAQADQVIDDPELGTVSNAPASTESTTGESLPASVSGARLQLHTRLGVDLQHSDAREETWENTTIALLEATVRRSEDLRFAVGMRARYHISAFSHDVPDAAAERTELDAAPTAGYVDIKVGNGANLQFGYQTVHMGRFDLFSAVDVLSVMDLRDGPATLPEALDVAQLAVRFDYDATSNLAFRVLYVPFFTPHILSLTESDYALAHLTEAQVESGLAGLGINNEVLAANLSRADRERLAENGFATFTPEAGLASQQAALRATLRGAAGELSLTAATALEHVPAIYFSQEAIDYLRDPSAVDAAERLQSIERPIRVEYGRFALLALDATLDVEPFSLGFEATYMFGRTLYTLGSGAYPDTLPLPDTTDVVQVGARLEFLHGSELVSSLEAFGAYTISAPHVATRSWVSLERGRYIAGVGAALGWMADFGLRLQLGAVALTGYTLVVVPRIAYVLLDTLELELGAIIIEGSPPPLSLTAHIGIGTLYDSTDQVFVGLSYSL